MLLELRDKLDAGMVGTSSSTLASRGDSDVLNALLSLGYNEREAAWAVKQIDTGLSVGEGIRQALKLLSKA